MKISIQSDHCIMQNGEFGCYVNNKRIESIISEAMPTTGGDVIGKINIEIELFDKEINVTKNGESIKESEGEE